MSTFFVSLKAKGLNRQMDKLFKVSFFFYFLIFSPTGFFFDLDWKTVFGFVYFRDLHLFSFEILWNENPTFLQAGHQNPEHIRPSYSKKTN